MSSRIDGSRSRKTSEFNAFGIHEMMPPVWIDRPAGTGNWLFMLFHDPATVILSNDHRSVESDSFICWPHGTPPITTEKPSSTET